jgi:hypothetical protein
MIRLARLGLVALSLLLVLAVAGFGPGDGATAQPGGSTTPASAPAATDGGY